MWESHALRTRRGSKEGFDSGVSWDQDFTLNERESERPIIYSSTRQARTGSYSPREKSNPARGKGSSFSYYAISREQSRTLLLPLV